jgi:hypothetical protein
VQTNVGDAHCLNLGCATNAPEPNATLETILALAKGATLPGAISMRGKRKEPWSPHSLQQDAERMAARQRRERAADAQDAIHANHHERATQLEAMALEAREEFTCREGW